MMEQSFDLICAQKHPELIDECIDLLNTQWPRSKTARLVSIQQGSSEGFPTTLLLINKHSNDDPKRQVVAHCKVSPVSVYHPSACFVESVVVAKELRGKGIGRIIMDKMEAYVKCRGIRIIYLTTHDQRGFYEKLGYSLCDPVVVYGGKCNSFKMDSGKIPFSSQHIRPIDTGVIQHKTSIEDIKTTDESEVLSSMMLQNATLIGKPQDTKNNVTNNNCTVVAKSVPLPPPPPPPLNNLAISHPRKLTKNDIVLKPEMKVTMKKELLF